MKLKSFLSFKPKLPKPTCSNVFSISIFNPKKHCFSLKRPRFRRRRFRPKFRKPFSVKALRFPKKPKLKFKKRRRRNRFSNKNPVPDADRFGEKVSELVSVFRTSGSKELDRVVDPNPNPESVVVIIAEKKEQPDFTMPIADPDPDPDPNVEVGDVCKIFESYVAGMIVEEGKVKDLMDVEEILYCWKNLKSPVFVDLVCRFYGEMCMDLFSAEEDEDEEQGKITTSTTTSTTTITSSSE